MLDVNELKKEVFVFIVQFWGIFQKEKTGKNLNFAKAKEIWGCSSVGRAPALQAGGHGFESHHLHQHTRVCSHKEEVKEIPSPYSLIPVP